jgi:hypothetical protein
MLSSVPAKLGYRGHKEAKKDGTCGLSHDYRSITHKIRMQLQICWCMSCCMKCLHIDEKKRCTDNHGRLWQCMQQPWLGESLIRWIAVNVTRMDACKHVPFVTECTLALIHVCMAHTQSMASVTLRDATIPWHM